MGNIYKLGDIDNEQFYMLPKGLFTNPQYKDLTNTARIVYAMLKDRMKLSMKEGWHDENGEVYINFTQETLAQFLNVTPRAVKQVMAALKDAGLISTKRQGLGKPNKIYIHKLLPLPLHGEINCPSEVKSDSPIRGNELPPINTDSIHTDNIHTDSVCGADAPPENTPSEKLKKPPARKKFIPPTLEEVQSYITEKRLNVDAKKFFDYYEAGDWHDGNGKAVKSWKQKCLTWDKHDNGRQVRTQPQQVSTQPKDIVDTDVDWSKFDG